MKRSPPVSSKLVYYGSIKCDALKAKNGEPCDNFAYYSIRDSKTQFHYRCGVHSDSKSRYKLPQDPDKDKQRLTLIENHKKEVTDSALERKKINQVGDVKCYQIRMMKEVPLVEGYLNVFPNNKHDNRIDGYGCAELSPMRLGPVKHCQPNLPNALNIENYHQFNKVWSSEETEGKPNETWYKLQREAYLDPIPHRHKFEPVKMKKEAKQENKNSPLYSVHLTLTGEEKHFSYLESRYFYCKAYECLAKKRKEYTHLCQLRKDGTNLIICGYDAYPITKSLYEHYCDPAKPFGHELVLYSLIVLTEEYPWDRYRREHSEIYEGIAHVSID